MEDPGEATMECVVFVMWFEANEFGDSYSIQGRLPDFKHQSMPNSKSPDEIV